MAKLSRRKFLAGALGGLAVLVATPYAFYHWRFGRPTSIIVAILKRRVGYLNTEAGSFERFAPEYVEYKREHKAALARLSAISLPFTYVTLYRWLPMGHPLRRLEDNVVTQYLLSTDFFLHEADESREVKYLSFYEPHLTPCRNPFAHLRRRFER
jgi:hypothetical protein